MMFDRILRTPFTLNSYYRQEGNRGRERGGEGERDGGGGEKAGE